eukprot:scaffold8309_cov116-Isochrysis_galbana.AAC.2
MSPLENCILHRRFCTPPTILDMLSIATPFALGFPERAPLFASTAEPVSCCVRPSSLEAKESGRS